MVSGEDVMRHKSYKEWLRLSLYDELDDAKKRLLEEHLRACPDCSSEMDMIRRMHEAICGNTMEQPQEELLQEARHGLQISLPRTGKSPNRYFN
jgi:hypothetical protein